MTTRRARPLSRLELLAAERSRLRLPAHGVVRVGVGYPGSYHVAHSSLAFQWVVELTTRVPGVGVERFCLEPGLAGLTLDSGIPLADLDLLAFSCSFELDAVAVLQTLDAAGIPRRSEQRGPGHPLVVVGGSLTTLNPLPLAPAVDLFCLGAAELLWPQLLELVRDGRGRDSLLAELAGRTGFLVPQHHLDPTGRPLGRLHKVLRGDPGRATADDIPASHRVTPNTEYRERALVEISRGCPERCRYCWVSHDEGRFACYPSAAVATRVQELAKLTRRIGLVAAAVGDHPGLAQLLRNCVDQGLEVAVSSLRIPAVVPEVLEPLAACGARSLTIAPEAGSDQLRRRLGKRVSNGEVLAAVANLAAAGIASVKMYFIVGLPEESDADLDAISVLVRECREIMVGAGRARGRLGELRVTLNPLVPKPYTPYHREAMLSAPEYRRRVARVVAGLRRVGNLRVDHASYREALWQGFLARGTASAFGPIGEAADGTPIARLLAAARPEVEAVTQRKLSAAPVWHFIGRAPRPAQPDP